MVTAESSGGRTCVGVRPGFAGEPWRECGADLPADRRFRCESCDGEIERRLSIQAGREKAAVTTGGARKRQSAAYWWEELDRREDAA